MYVTAGVWTGVGPPPVGFADPNDMTFLLQVPLDVGKPVAELRRRQEADSLREHRLRRVDESHRCQRSAGEVVEKDAVVPKGGHRGMAQVDDEVGGHLGDIARSEREGL